MTYTVGVIAEPIDFDCEQELKSVLANTVKLQSLLVNIFQAATHGQDDIRVVTALQPNLIEILVQEMAALYKWGTTGVSGNLAENCRLDALVLIGSDLNHIDAVMTAEEQGIPVFQHDVEDFSKEVEQDV